jgi:hypothetical protein
MKDRQLQKQIPPLRCGMTTKEQATAKATTNADPLRDDNKRTGKGESKSNGKGKGEIQGSFGCVAHNVP